MQKNRPFLYAMLLGRTVTKRKSRFVRVTLTGTMGHLWHVMLWVRMRAIQCERGKLEIQPQISSDIIGPIDGSVCCSASVF